MVLFNCRGKKIMSVKDRIKSFQNAPSTGPIDPNKQIAVNNVTQRKEIGPAKFYTPPSNNILGKAITSYTPQGISSKSTTTSCFHCNFLIFSFFFFLFLLL
jgi:hypothetical protein